VNGLWSTYIAPTVGYQRGIISLRSPPSTNPNSFWMLIGCRSESSQTSRSTVPHEPLPAAPGATPFAAVRAQCCGISRPIRSDSAARARMSTVVELGLHERTVHSACSACVLRRYWRACCPLQSSTQQCAVSLSAWSCNAMRLVCLSPCQIKTGLHPCEQGRASYRAHHRRWKCPVAAPAPEARAASGDGWSLLPPRDS